MSVEMAVGTALQQICKELNAAYFERRSAIEAITLALLAKEHVFLLGPPGTAKSQLARDYLSRIEYAKYFELLLSKSRPDQAVLGPYDLRLLREQSIFHRQIKGYLLTADFALLDEIGKMSPTLGHDLLAALNERVRHEVADGNSVHEIPLRTAITASNELPAGESEDAAALWDRLLIRVTVDYLDEAGNFAALMATAVARPTKRVKRTTLTCRQLADVTDNEVPLIPIPTAVIDAVVSLKGELREQGIRVSDRRWRASMRVLQAAAYLAGRDKVDVDDLGVLRYTLWDAPEQRRAVERAALKIANPLNEDSMVILDAVHAIRAEVVSRKGKALADRAGYGSEALAKLKTLEREVAQLRQKYLTAGRSQTRVDEVRDQVLRTRGMVLTECLDIADPGRK